jgi:glycerol-3-phosphate dehydrogenase
LIRESDSSQALDRASMLDRLAREEFDLAIIGGGISGAAIAREAALRGLRVALVDKGDFAGGTSSASSKLIHGGLRYLPQLQIRLVYQALRERERLRHVTAPHLVRPMHFAMPFFRGRRPGRHSLIAGLWLYDLIARVPRSERHRLLSNAALSRLEPGLVRDGLVGGATYFDAWGDDARLTLENVLDAAYHGAAIANYVEVESLSRSSGKFRILKLVDLESAKKVELRANWIVNAAGPWGDQIRRMDDPRAKPIARLTKGVHLVIPAARLPIRNSIVLTDHHGRIVFLMRHEDRVLVGTTDTDYYGEPSCVAVERSDVEYLCGVIAEAFPGFRLTSHDVEYAFAGLRVLPRLKGQAPSSVPRDEIVAESASGLLTVAGGKLTTHRAVAEAVTGRWFGQATPSPSRSMPLPGARRWADDESYLRSLPEQVRGFLGDRYGTRAELVAKLAAENLELTGPISPNARAIAAEVPFAIRFEFALTIEDFLVRRTSLAWRSAEAAREATEPVAHLMARELGWDQSHKQEEIKRALNRLQAPSF